MKKIFAGSLIAILLSASAALAAVVPPKGTEGPDVQRTTHNAQYTQPIKGTEGPDVR